MADRFPLIIDNSAEKIKELVSGDNLDLTKSNLKNADYIQSAGVNVAGVATATSLIGDGSQLTNLPPSGGSLTATASGTLADGSKVIVNADGTVSVVAESETTGSGIGSPTVFESATSEGISSTYDPNNQKVVIGYYDTGNSNYGTAIVGTVSGTSISFGSPVVFASSSSSHISVIYDSTNQKVVIAYRDRGNSNYGTAVVGTVSGTSISFGSPVIFSSAFCTQIGATFDSTNQKVVIAYSDADNSYRGTAIVGTVSGTSISFGSPVVYNSSGSSSNSVVYDSTNGKVVIAYSDSGNSDGKAVVGTVSGTSITFGSEVVFESASVGAVSSVYDSTNQKIVIAYYDDDNSDYGTAVVGTVSGTSITFGSPVVFNSANTVYAISAIYDSTNNKVVISYYDGGNSGYGTLIVGTVSGTSISFGSPTVFNSGIIYISSLAFDSSTGKVIVTYQDGGNSYYGTALVFGNTGFPVPSAGSPEVFESSSISNISSTFDSTNNKVVIAYQDSGNSNYGTAVVGTVSGTSISFGTPAIFKSAHTSDISITHDSTNGKVVISWRDQTNSTYGTAIVGTVSGTSISFGSSAVFESAQTSQISSTFDSTNGKVVIAYQDGWNSDYGTAVVGTVSGTSISFGTPVVFESARSVSIRPVYDPNSQKVVIAYRDDGNSYYGTAIVGTVSGTSISFGSPVVFNSSTSEYISATYDSTNNKVVIAYRDSSNSGYGKAVVGTVSGTSISFGSPTIFESAATYFISATYDSSNQKVVISYSDQGNSNYGTAIVGTVSGTSVSFGSPVLFESANTNRISAVYDSSNQKVVIAYTDVGNSEYGTAAVFSQTTISTNLTTENFIGISNGAYTNGQTATVQIMGAVDDAQSSLTPGQAYYVQDDGTLAESGSVFAGTAIAATKLIVRG